MNRYEKIRELRKELSEKEPWISPTYILDNILSIMEEDTIDMDEYPCCGEFETCERACAPRANYFKENSRVELNKLALSILKESLKDEGYRQTWVSNIAMAFYDAYDIRYGHCGYNDYEHRNRGAKLFMDRLFGEIE